MPDKKYIIKARVCDVIISTPLNKDQARESAKALKKKIPTARVKVHKA